MSQNFPAQIAQNIVSKVLTFLRLDGSNNLLVNTDAGKLTAPNVAAGSVVKLGAGNLQAVNNISTTNLGLLSTASTAALTQGVLYDLTTTQVGALTTAQIAALASGTITALSTAQLATLTTAQIIGLTVATLPTVDFHGTPFSNALAYVPGSSPGAVVYK